MAKEERIDIDVEEVKQIAQIFASLSNGLHDCGKFKPLSVMVGAMCYSKGNEFAILEMGFRKEELEVVKKTVDDLTNEQRNLQRFGDLK